jgi:hypothetical protein
MKKQKDDEDDEQKSREGIEKAFDHVAKHRSLALGTFSSESGLPPLRIRSSGPIESPIQPNVTE